MSCSVRVFTITELLQLFSNVISYGKGIPRELNYSWQHMFTSRQSLNQVFNVCITHANLIPSVGAVNNVLLGSDTPWHAMRLRTRQGPHRYIQLELQRICKPSIIVDVPAVWESVIVAKRQFGESSHESHFNGAMYFPSRVLRSP